MPPVTNTRRPDRIPFFTIIAEPPPPPSEQIYQARSLYHSRVPARGPVVPCAPASRGRPIPSELPRRPRQDRPDRRQSRSHLGWQNEPLLSCPWPSPAAAD